MKKSPYLERLSLVRKKLTEHKLDAFWILQPDNRRYLSGFKAADGQLTESSGSLLISKKKALLLTGPIYAEEAQKEAGNFQVITLRKGLLEELPKILSRLKINRLGFEPDYLLWGVHRSLMKEVRKMSRPVKLVPVINLVETMRLVKDKAEVRKMDVSAKMISEILESVIGNMKPGQTEKEVAWQIESMAREAGANGLAFPSIVASGPNGALPHAVPGSRRIRSGEPIVIDAGVKKDGYCSDITRTVFLGVPTRRFKVIYKIVREAQLAALDILKPGVDCEKVDSLARNIIKEAGFGDYFGHGLGHGVELATHEQPRLAPRQDTVLRKGMVVTVEPGIYLPGKGGVRLEETVIIEMNGARILTTNNNFYEF